MHRTGQLQPNQEQISTLARAKGTGNVDRILAADDKTSFFNKSDSVDDDFEQSFKEYRLDNKSTQNIVDILELLENSNNQTHSILIEGAPGLGKTILLKQIAYEWANRKILVNIQLLFLIPLRNPKVQEFSSVTDLVRHFSNWDDEGLSISCAKHIEKNKGKNVAFLLDGFDELPLELQKTGFFSEVIKLSYDKLSGSSVIITSRPHSCATLRSRVSSLVDILGFTTDCQKLFLESALKSQPHKLQKLLAYLDSNPAVSSLCFIPFNMTVLLWLFNIGASLPNSLTELYNSFILHTVIRHIKLANTKAEIKNVTDIDSLPKQYKKVLQKISALCLKAMDGEKLKIVFTLEEVKEACPKINEVPGGINCFGLLQAIEHYSSESTMVTSLSFIHFSVQEFLAAYHIASLPPKKELHYIQENFWSDLHSNVFAMYVGLTKGQRPSFKTYLSSFGKSTTFPTMFLGKTQSGRKIANKLFEDERKCLTLFHCFYEANDPEGCDTIAKNFYASKMITLHKTGTPLLPNSLQCLKLFLAKSSNKQWLVLNMTHCCIGDAGISALHQILAKTNKDISIDEIILSDNSLTVQAIQEITEIAISCNANVLDLSFNCIENGTLFEKLTLAISTLQNLDLSYNKLTSDGAIAFFSSLRMNKHITLKELQINSNSIDDRAVEEISHFLRENVSLDVLRIYGNQFSEDSMNRMVNSLKENNTLRELMLTTCSDQLRQQLKSVEKLINSTRKEGMFLKIRFATIVVVDTNIRGAVMYPCPKPK